MNTVVVRVIDQEMLKQSGAVSLGEYFNQSEHNIFGSFNQQGWSPSSYVNLRGLGETNTLVLMDGQRLAKEPGASVVDFTLLPLAAIERIEVLKDGASAVYGSDALAGVVNIITKKDFREKTFVFSMSTPKSKGGKQDDISASLGFLNESGSLSVVIENRNSDAVQVNERLFANSQSLISQTGSPGSYQGVDGKWHPDPTCDKNKILDLGAVGSVCGYDVSFMEQMPKTHAQNLFTNYSLYLNENLELIGQSSLGRLTSVGHWAPNPGQIRINSLDVLNGIRKDLGERIKDFESFPATLEPGETFNIKYRLVELGNRKYQNIYNTAHHVIGMNGNYLNLDFKLTYSISRMDLWFMQTAGNSIASCTNEAMVSSKFNPFALPGFRDKESVLSKCLYSDWDQNFYQTKSFDTNVSGENFGFSWVLGFSDQVENLELTRDTLTHFGNTWSTQFDGPKEVDGNCGKTCRSSRRDNQAIFLELLNKPLENLEVTLALRKDYFSDFGSTFNPKLGMLYRFSPYFLTRASYGTGFKAPTLETIVSEPYWGGSNDIIDTSLCEHATGPQKELACTPNWKDVHVLPPINPKEQKSESYNWGVLLDLSNELSLEMDYWQMALKQVLDLDFQAIFDAEARGYDLSKYGIKVIRPEPKDLSASTSVFAAQYAEVRMQNLGTTLVTGLDTKLDYHTPDWKFIAYHNHCFSYLKSAIPGVPARQMLQKGMNPRWRNTSTLSYLIGDDTLAVTGRSISGFTMPDGKKYGGYSELDLSYALQINKKSTLGLGIKNVANKQSHNVFLDEGTVFDFLSQRFFVTFKQVL